MTIDSDRDDDALEDGIARIMADFGDDYWLERDGEGGFPEDFYRAMAEGGWLGIGVPEELGGSGLGVRECAVVMRRIACSPGAMAAASAIHMNVFGPRAIVAFGTEAQRRDWIPPIVRGEVKMAFAVTEPDAGLDTGAITTRAEPDGAGGYRITGQKIWTSTAQVADKVLLLVRTTPRQEGGRRTDGLSLFYLDLDRRYCDIREIEKMGRKAVDSNEIFFDGLPATAGELVGEAGQGFRQLLGSLNPERILVAAEAVGIGQEWRSLGPNSRRPGCCASKPPSSATGTSPAAPRPTPPNTWPPRPATGPASGRCLLTAAWATPRRSMSSACCARS